MTHTTRRARHRALRRGVTDFPALLRSSRPGIHFTALITATVLTEPDSANDTDLIANHIRQALRSAAAEALREQDPTDLPAARDACNRHLSTPRTTANGIKVTAAARLTLAPDDQAAVNELLTAARTQGIKDTLESQRTQALAERLAHPAALLAWLLSNSTTDLAGLPDDKALADTAERLARYPRSEGEPFEVQVLALVRDFFDQFPRQEQKRMLMQLLADAMRGARQPAHADKIQELLENTTNPAGTVPGP
ncbi:hypothetical protein [Streptomyces sp. PSAA01]|uniref:hypothetical protein n=1 Tax=Streptomyces sp. PSAA01 TaxID=2912762 RepID=UPI001F27EA22|nr:hypothetical protein [Streptomyces sp. PSAA01]MCG0284052.1 hypothetical protein [Streptomyces sp. PSAA01]